MPVTKRGLVAVKQLPLPLPWSAVLVPTSAFPIPEEELTGIASFIQNLCGYVVGSRQLTAETFVQVEQSDDKECRRVYSERASEWIPEVGLGVWPDREPPATWTQEEFMNLLPGTKPRPLMHQVLRITGSPQAKSDAFGAMLPFGPVLRVMTTEDGDAFLEKTTAILLPTIKDPTFTCYPFYVPLLDEKGLTSATREQLEAWFSGASVYFRESFENSGILFAIREPLRPVIEKLGGRCEACETPTWYVPH